MRYFTARVSFPRTIKTTGNHPSKRIHSQSIKLSAVQWARKINFHHLSSPETMDFCRFREWAIKWREKFSGGEISLRDFSTGTLAANCLHTSSHDIFVHFTTSFLKTVTCFAHDHSHYF